MCKNRQAKEEQDGPQSFAETGGTGKQGSLSLSSSPTGLDNEEKNCLSSMEHMGLSLSPPLLSRPQQQRPTWEEQGHHSLFLFFSLFSQGWKEQRPDHGSKNSSLSLLLLGCHLQQNQRQGRREAGAYLFSSQVKKA